MSEQGSHMMAGILAQPGALTGVVEKNAARAMQFGSQIRTRADGTLYIVGTGTSFHCAELAARFFAPLHAGERGIRTVPLSAYEFVNYTPALRKDDTVVVISHRGYKNFSHRSLVRSVETGCHTAAVTGIDSTIGDNDAEAVFRTVEQEESSAHTVSFTTALGVMLAVSAAVTRDAGEAGEYIRSTIARVSELMSQVLGGRETLRRTLMEAKVPRRIWIAGGGPNAVIAKEGALKIQETCYMDAFGIEVEQLIHGPMRAASIPEDLFIPIIWGETGSRGRELATSIMDAGGRVMTISDRAKDPHDCLLEDFSLDELLSPFITVLPLQLAALYFSILQGTNPDSFRKDDPYFAKLDAKLKL